jgi:transcriptional regulator GlxA family with amidase domain
MKRREFVEGSAAFGLLTMLSSCTGRQLSPNPAAASESTPSAANPPKAATSTQNQPIINPLTPPAHGMISVAFVVSDGTVMIDLAGPWEVFNDVQIPSRGATMDDQMPFHTYTVAESMKPVSLSGGLKVVPDYTFANAPVPKVIVIPAQSGNKAMLNWIRIATKTTDVTMSVCTGAFILASTGLLSGKAATTHHASYKSFAMQFPDVSVTRGVRFVEAGNLATSGGLSSGIDLALRVVERYFGRKIATDTAYEMEYQGQGWMDANSNAVYLKTAVSTDEHPLCPICSMEVDASTAPKSIYKGKSYYFCSQAHKDQFDAAPEKWQ